MGYTISSPKIADGSIFFLREKSTLSGVVKIAEKVANDFSCVFGERPEIKYIDEIKQSTNACPIIVATLGHSDLLTSFFEKGIVDCASIEGKREVYSITVTESLENFDKAVIVAGSDKRGTVYGLFRLSEELGVSPFIDWLDIKPEHMDSFEFETGLFCLSKEPSVKFRGFFINDEWPAFGNFCNKNYGGFNALVYEHVFELLLRLKGNYMWPAMWSAIFPNDGPGLANAELADELGVIMGASHHEPCLRQGEEYKYLRGKDSIYGDAWNFITNREGITRFWEDGLKRSGKFENVITVGMRGEADTAILGRAATLKDNIDLLRDVLKTQNSLIKKYVNENLDDVPRMLALYKEVEPYFYGDDSTKGLIGDPELEGVTLMLCDDNHGNLRTVPTKEMRSHKGGYGMYYHFDYHGLPISYEWLNTSYLPKVWEQMTAAYDFGIRDLWIVNVGDIFSTEYPLAYFLDLAYDFDKWGTSNIHSASDYTKSFVDFQFNGKLSEKEKDETVRLLKGYTKITGRRRTEPMNDNVYAPFAYKECEKLLEEIASLMNSCESLYKSLSKNAAFAFYELVYINVIGNLNVQKMWLLTTLNHAYASFGDTYALTLGKIINDCIAKDKALVDELHSIHDGKWYGMGMSEHIGFTRWNEEECRFPVVHSFEPANKSRLIVSVPGTDQHTEGLVWTGRNMTLGSFLDPSCDEGFISLSTSYAGQTKFELEADSDFITLSETKGFVSFGERKLIRVTVNRELLSDNNKNSVTLFDKTIEKGNEAGLIAVKSDESFVLIRVPVNTYETLNVSKYEKGTYLWCGESDVNLGQIVMAMPSYSRLIPEGTKQMHYISIEAEHFYTKNDTPSGSFNVIPEYGKTLSALKVYPQDIHYTPGVDAPCVSYRFVLPKSGKYTVSVYTNPSNPCGRIPEMNFAYRVNNEEPTVVNMIPSGFAVGDGNMAWQKGVLDQIRITEFTNDFKEGLNELTFMAVNPGFVLEKIVIFPENERPAKSYLGPTETFYI